MKRDVKFESIYCKYYFNTSMYFLGVDQDLRSRDVNITDFLVYITFFYKDTQTVQKIIRDLSFSEKAYEAKLLGII